ncbi:MAG: 50S ribosomal protein L23 [Atopobiaceae bacterium]
MNSVYNVIIRPVITERAYDMMEQGKYTFEVARTAPKEEIRDAVEKLFNVHVVSVHTINVKPKNKRVRYAVGQTRRWKKAIVKLAEGEQIEIFANNSKDEDTE